MLFHAQHCQFERSREQVFQNEHSVSSSVVENHSIYNPIPFEFSSGIFFGHAPASTPLQQRQAVRCNLLLHCVT